MAFLSQSPFLEALGWATLNSFWQMALLWTLFKGLQYLVPLSSPKKYALALASLAAGLLWFTITFFTYYYNGSSGLLSSATHNFAPTSATWSTLLTSASITYLLLLAVPAGRLLKSWSYINRLRTQGLYKPDADYRLYVKKIALQLGIQKKVEVYLSGFVTSPVTIGYLKPMILIPIAALNALTVQQVEAVLLHELSHIRRSDFLINLIVNVVHTVFYYNPFVKLFVAVIDAEREKSCDETVLQFGYEKVSYAAALLTLEKNAAASAVLAIGAAGKQHLLKRIEKIVGMEKKTAFSFTQFAGMMATVLLVILVNSVLFVSKPAEKNKALGLVAFEKPFFTIENESVSSAPALEFEPASSQLPIIVKGKMVHNPKQTTESNEIVTELLVTEELIVDNAIIPAAYNMAEATTTSEEKKLVSKTVQATKKVLANTQWQEVEKEIADAMTESEKAQARQEYLLELEKIDWQGLENNLKINYKELDWIKINQQLGSAIAAMRLDSLQKVYVDVLHTLEMAETYATIQGSTAPMPLPDASHEQVRAIKKQLRQSIDSIRILRKKDVISL